MAKLLYASSSKNSDMFYAVHVEVPDPFFYVDNDEGRFVFLDHREFEVFKEHCPDKSIHVVLLNPLLDAADALPGNDHVVNKLAALLVRTYGMTDRTIEIPRHLPVDMADALRAAGFDVRVTAPFFPQRLIKSQQEIVNVREALRRTHAAYRHIENVLREAIIDGDVLRYRGDILTSEQLKLEVEQVLLAEDMLNVEGMIISCGPHAAIPHHRGHGPLRPHQTIICDIFPRHRASGYFADMTRTYIKGSPTETQRRMFDAVLAAQEASFAAIKAGVPGTEGHDASVRTFLERGFDVGDKGFIHGTGHGLGIDVHEDPYVSKRGTRVLETGNIVTVEPGLYYPEHGGVRIEDVVVVSETGCENLTNYPKQFIIP